VLAERGNDDGGWEMQVEIAPALRDRHLRPGGRWGGRLLEAGAAGTAPRSDRRRAEPEPAEPGVPGATGQTAHQAEQAAEALPDRALAP